MEMQEALEFAVSGNAILFLGAGFSTGALNLRKLPFKTGTLFSDYLGKTLGLPPGLGLEDTAEEYLERFGTDGLIAEIQKEFTVSSVKPFHTAITRIPWKKIYTTNYDNVVEVAASKCGKKFMPVTLEDNILKTPKKNDICIHINGFVDKLNRDSLDSYLKMTDRSYSTSSVVDSPWLAMLRSDIRVAKAVFFVGYSLYDLDIKRVLFSDDNTKRKCFFVIGEKPDPATERRTARYGSTININTSDFANLISKVDQEYVPINNPTLSLHCFKRFEQKTGAQTFKDKTMFDLFMLGDVNESAVAESLSGNRSYYLKREIGNDIIQRISGGDKYTVIHANLGNGKTLLLEGIKWAATENGYDVFQLLEMGDDTLEELEKILQAHPKSIIIVEEYVDKFEVVRHFAVASSDVSALIMTARTSTHDAIIDDLCNLLDTESVAEINVDKLSDDDIAWCVRILDEYGMWGNDASLSYERKIRYLTDNCKKEFHAILLKIMESPSIGNRYKALFDLFKGKKDHKTLLMSILLLTTFNYNVTLNMLADLFGLDKVIDSSFRKNQGIQSLINFGSGEFTIKSAVASEYLLKKVANSMDIADVLILMAKGADRAGKVSEFYRYMVKNLMRYGKLQDVFPEHERRPAVIKYYESIKSLEASKKNPMFWLQFAIACLVEGELDRSETYFKTAYSFADKRFFDTYQIDNHYARYLLERAISISNKDEALQLFRKARTIINDQAKKERRHFPFRVAKSYEELFDKHGYDLNTKETEEIRKAASFVLSKIDKLPEHVKHQKKVFQCEKSLKYVINKIAAKVSQQTV